MNSLLSTLGNLVGIGDDSLSVVQMSLRAAVVFVIAVVLVRISKRRFMSRGSAFDLLLAVVLGSIVSRVITGDAPFFAGLAAALTLVAMHWLFSALGFRWHRFSVLVKGEPRVLVRDGRMNPTEMRASHITEGDLWEDLRGNGVSDLSDVAEARLERNGEISVIQRDQEPAEPQREEPHVRQAHPTPRRRARRRNPAGAPASRS